MLLRNRLAAACLAASLLATPFAAFGKTQSESLLQQAIDVEKSTGNPAGTPLPDPQEFV